ncbi:aluminum-activated malate transporter 2-like [Tripterygium wilfordii]|uniref:aluminum-activated malate transporter 2-like n=1 Tax=Tripterygium wilfordii TaxID=458696 RepID=UPI0018F80E18|nr:aluminum-activated malate transporter 2-like [Tripterygium wilfordii]
MEVVVGSTSQEKAGLFARFRCSMKGLSEKFKTRVIDMARQTKKLAQDDPRRVIHSLKVGLTLALVSTLYYYQPLFDNFGESAMWAVMTVVVVFEFSVGATLGKGVNRGVATLLAGSLGVGAHHLASLSGHVIEPILLGFFVFILGGATTFVRFFPKIKARYDYGLLIFILTFSLISVSGFREDQIIELAHRRLSTIIIGGSACIIVSILVCPVWAGEDLHCLIALNMEKLGNFLEGFGGELFGESKDDDDKSFLEAHKSILNSKSSEESLANFARWEPCHGGFRFQHPWKQYLKIGGLIRECAYRIEALQSCLSSDHPQATTQVTSKIKDSCMKMSMNCGKALKELGLAVRTMTKPASSADAHIQESKSASKDLASLLKSDSADLLTAIPAAAATVASLLLDVVECSEKISESVDELASLAHFKANYVLPEKSEVKSSSKAVDCPPDHVVIDVSEGNRNNSSVTLISTTHVLVTWRGDVSIFFMYYIEVEDSKKVHFCKKEHVILGPVRAQSKRFRFVSFLAPVCDSLPLAFQKSEGWIKDFPLIRFIYFRLISQGGSRLTDGSGFAYT